MCHTKQILKNKNWLVLGTTAIYPSDIIKECPGEFLMGSYEGPRRLGDKSTCNDESHHLVQYVDIEQVTALVEISTHCDQKIKVTTK